MDSAGQLCWSHWGSLLQLQLDGSWDYDVQNGFIHCLTPWGTAGSPGFTPRFHVIQGFSLRTWPFHMISPAEHLIFLYSSSGIPKVQSGSCLALLRLVCRTAVMLPLPYSNRESKSRSLVWEGTGHLGAWIPGGEAPSYHSVLSGLQGATSLTNKMYLHLPLSGLPKPHPMMASCHLNHVQIQMGLFRNFPSGTTPWVWFLGCRYRLCRLWIRKRSYSISFLPPPPPAPTYTHSTYICKLEVDTCIQKGRVTRRYRAVSDTEQFQNPLGMYC